MTAGTPLRLVSTRSSSRAWGSRTIRAGPTRTRGSRLMRSLLQALRPGRRRRLVHRPPRLLRLGCVVRPERWSRPASASLVRVIAREPGSRPQSDGENHQAERGVKSLRGGSKSAGRSNVRVLSASTEKQWGSRAAHVTAKAMSGRASSGQCPVGSLRGRRIGTHSRSGSEQERPVCAASSAKTSPISRW
jgi:hypothetical protein